MIFRLFARITSANSKLFAREKAKDGATFTLADPNNTSLARRASRAAGTRAAETSDSSDGRMWRFVRIEQAAGDGGPGEAFVEQSLAGASTTSDRAASVSAATVGSTSRSDFPWASSSVASVDSPRVVTVGMPCCSPVIRDVRLVDAPSRNGHR
jgi:hypothetical protein